MALHYSRNATVTFNSVDLSDHVASVIVDESAEEVDITAMGATARAIIPGLRGDSVTVTFYVDMAASKVEATIGPFVGSSTGAALVVKNDSAAVSSTNPSWTMTAAPLQYQPINASIGDAHTTTVVFRPVAGQSLTKATA